MSLPDMSQRLKAMVESSAERIACRIIRMDDISGLGSTSTQQFTSALRQVLADDSVRQILIDIDSPGGSVYGVSVLASEIVKARAQKPVIAVANSLAASAAYWIGCSASEFYVTPGGEVGSIGVWQAHFDYSKALEEEGGKPTLISAGKYKVEGNPYVPLVAEAQAFIQSRVDDYYNAFVKGVAKGRGVSVNDVRSGMGEGRVLGSDAALAQSVIGYSRQFAVQFWASNRRCPHDRSSCTCHPAHSQASVRTTGGAD